MTELQAIRLASGITLDVWDSGPRDAPALIFLHGFPESYRSWRHQIAHLSTRFRCIAPDQRGYGGSSKPANVRDYVPDRLIGDIFGLADALDVPRFTVIGHDWGGAIAWGVALMGQFNGRVTQAVIANAPHPALFQRLLYTDPVQRAASQYMRLFRDSASDALVREHGLGGVLRKAFGDRAVPSIEPDEQAALAHRWQDRDAAFAMLNWYRASPIEVPAMDAAYTAPAGWQPPALPRSSLPTLVIWGMDDTALPPCNLVGLEALVSNLKIVEAPGSGHFVPWEAPGAVNAALDKFLRVRHP